MPIDKKIWENPIYYYGYYVNEFLMEKYMFISFYMSYIYRLLKKYLIHYWRNFLLYLYINFGLIIFKPNLTNIKEIQILNNDDERLKLELLYLIYYDYRPSEIAKLIPNVIVKIHTHDDYFIMIDIHNRKYILTDLEEEEYEKEEEVNEQKELSTNEFLDLFDNIDDIDKMFENKKSVKKSSFKWITGDKLEIIKQNSFNSSK